MPFCALPMSSWRSVPVVPGSLVALHRFAENLSRGHVRCLCGADADVQWHEVFFPRLAEARSRSCDPIDQRSVALVLSQLRIADDVVKPCMKLSCKRLPHIGLSRIEAALQRLEIVESEA